jgi:ligand-binding sensor domain-containing protein
LKVFAFLFFLFTGFLFAQNPFYIPIDNASGLASNSVYDVFQDSRGFMWFATGKGLCRYDGNNILTFTADFQTAKSGSCIQEDKYGRVWYENFDGFLYYVRNGVLFGLKQEKPLGYFKYGISDKYIMVLEKDGVQFYDLRTLKPSKKVNLDLNHLKFVHFSNDVLYILDDKIYQIDENGEVKTTEYPANFDENYNTPIVQKSGKGIVIISKFTKKYCYFEDGKFNEKKFQFPVQFIQNVSVINDNIWLCSTEGITRFNKHSEVSKNFFNDKNISFIYQDKQFNYWISTINEGLYFVSNFDTKIVELPSKPTVLSRSENSLLAGTEKDEIYSLDTKTLQPRSLYKGKLNHDIYQIYKDEVSGNLYFTSSVFHILSHGKLQEYQVGAVKSVEKIDHKYFAFAASSISGVFTNNSHLKSEWDAVFQNFETQQVGNLTKTAIFVKSNGKSTIYNDKNKTIYFATNSGLMMISAKKKEELKYKNKSLYLSKLGVYKGTVYAFSTNEKMYTINSENKVSLFSFEKFKITEAIDRIAFQNELLFVFTQNSVYEINLESNTSKRLATFTKDIQITDAKTIDGKYYFASSKGIIIQSYQKSTQNEIPKLFINSVFINDKKADLNIENELNHDENNIKISYTVLSFIPNEKYSVLYSINGSKWNRLDADSKNLLLSSLSPNKYEIKLKIDTGNQTRIEKIDFEIKKPYWQNTFALVGFGILTGLLFYLIYRSRIAKIRKSNQLVIDKIHLEKNVNQSKLKAIKSQMNPHFFYNALNTLQSYILSNEKKQAIDYLSKFSSLTRTILEMTEKDEISINDEIKALTLYLDIEKARFVNDFSYTISTNFNTEIDNLKIPTMLLQPYIENAVKHGLLHIKDEKKLELIFEKTEENLKISIIDNGIGRKKSMELNKIKNKNHKSFATDATQNRIELLNQLNSNNISIEYIDNENDLGFSLGTKVVFILPIIY